MLLTCAHPQRWLPLWELLWEACSPLSDPWNCLHFSCLFSEIFILHRQCEIWRAPVTLQRLLNEYYNALQCLSVVFFPCWQMVLHRNREVWGISYLQAFSSASFIGSRNTLCACDWLLGNVAKHRDLAGHSEPDNKLKWFSGLKGRGKKNHWSALLRAGCYFSSCTCWII